MPLLSTFGAASARSFGGIGAAAAGAGLDVDEVFSTYLYDGTGSAQTITNGIDLSGEGGLVWFRDRENANGNFLFDTERGATKRLRTHGTFAENTVSTGLTAFNSNGFTIGSNAFMNGSNNDIASWTWRKAPKFFDVVTYTGNGNASQTISHSLGTTVGMLIIKKTSDTGSWNVYHRGTGNNKSLELQSTDAAYNNVPWGSVTSTTFEARSDIAGNDNGATYVAYLFAHNNSDGEFGPDADQDIIKCGSVTIGGTGNATVNLGFEPQWLLIRNASSSGYDWQIFDTMRGFRASPDNNAPSLAANSTSGDSGQGDPNLTSTGFEWDGGGGQPNKNYIYMAIRRGPLAEPESATNVFAIDTRGSTGDGNEPAFRSTFPVDFALQKIKNSGTNWTAKTRLIGQKDLNPNATGVEQTANNNQFDYMNGHFAKTNTDANEVGWMWKRAPSYFDVVGYQSTTSAQTLNHNLSAIPEMMWVKNRDDTKDWQVYHSALGNTKYLQLNTNDAEATASNRWNDTSPTATQFTVGTAQKVNDVTATRNYVAYLFGTVAGVSKVGSYTGTGGYVLNDCGFSNGARFVLIKRTDSSGDWYLWDTTRGITSGNDPYLLLNSTNSEVTNTDYIAEDSRGFYVSFNAPDALNASGGTYIFYAIA